MTEYSGFARTKLLRLQENLEEDLASVGLKSVLAGVSQDYAVIAQKAGDAESLGLFDHVFAEEYGVSLDFLAQQYDARIRETIQSIEIRLNEGLEKELLIGDKLKQLQDDSSRLAEEVKSAILNEFNVKFTTVEKRLDEVLSSQNEFINKQVSIYKKSIEDLQVDYKKSIEELQAELQAVSSRNNYLEGLKNELQAQEEKNNSIQHQLNESLSNAHNWYLRAIDYQGQIEKLKGSSSWKVTAPLRYMALKFDTAGEAEVSFPRKFIVITKKLARNILVKTMRGVINNSEYKRHAKSFLVRYPSLYNKLVNIAYGAGLVGGNNFVNKPSVTVPFNPNSFIQGLEPDDSDLSESAKIYYQRLKKAIQENSEEAR
ncbi:hypothetical protein ACFQDN_04525 [Pseudomonas asuensis]